MSGRRRRPPSSPWLTVAAVVAAVAIGPGAARADTVEDLAAWLPADAPVVVRADAAAAEALLALADRAGVPGLSGRSLLLLKLGARAVLGFDPTGARGWRAGGFDASAPVLVSLARIDTGRAAQLYRSLTDGSAPPEPSWHSRLVWKARDRARARATVESLLSAAPGRALPAPDQAFAARRLGADAVLVAHLRGDVLVVDVVVAFAGGAAPRELARAAGQAPDGSGFRDRLDAGAAAELTAPGLAVWIDPARLVDSWIAHRHGVWIRRSRHAGRTPDPLPDLEASCEGVRALASEGAFTDVVVRLDPGRSAIEARTVWGLRGAHRLAGMLLPADDRLLAGSLDGDAVVAGSLYLSGLAPLRGLPRPDILSHGLRRLGVEMARCGPAVSTATLAMVGWPHLAGMMLDQVASIDPRAETLVESIRNAAFAARRVALDPGRVVAVAEASFEPEAVPIVESMLDAFFGGRRERPGAPRPHTAWGRGPVRPFSRAPDERPVTFGAGTGAGSVRWYLAADTPGQAPPRRLAHLVARPRAIATQLGMTGVPALVLGLFERVTATLRFDGDRLVAESSWSP